MAWGQRDGGLSNVLPLLAAALGLGGAEQPPKVGKKWKCKNCASCPWARAGWLNPPHAHKCGGCKQHWSMKATVAPVPGAPPLTPTSASATQSRNARKRAAKRLAKEAGSTAPPAATSPPSPTAASAATPPQAVQQPAQGTCAPPTSAPTASTDLQQGTAGQQPLVSSPAALLDGATAAAWEALGLAFVAIGDLAKRYPAPALFVPRVADTLVTEALAGEVSEELATSQGKLAALDELIAKMKALQDPVVQDAISKKEAEQKILKDKVSRLTTKDAKPGTKGQAAVQRLQGIQKAQAGRFTAQAQRAKEGAEKSQKRLEADLAAIDEAAAVLATRRKAVTDAHAAADEAHKKVREQNVALAAEVDRLLSAKVLAAETADPPPPSTEVVSVKDDDGDDHMQEDDDAGAKAAEKLWALVQRKATNLKEEDFPILKEVPTGADLSMLSEMYARYASLDMGGELPWLITFAQLGASVGMAKSLLGGACWGQIYPDLEEPEGNHYVPRQLVILIGQRLLAAKATHDVIVETAEAKARAKAALADAEAKTAANAGWKIVGAPRGKKPRRAAPYAAPAADASASAGSTD